MSTRSHPNGHSSRRDNHSISSSASTSSGRTERATSSRSSPAVESAVTRLLVSIKALLESLTRWSQQQVDESYVSDVYVRLGNDFNEAVQAFSAYNIDMAELVTVPEDLRAVLEQCLAEDANQENLDIYLPEVRQIITNLLQGLRAKQSIYRRIVSDHKHRSGASEGGERTSTRPRSHRTGSRTVTEEERQDAAARRGTTRSSRREVPSQTATVQDNFVGGFAPIIAEYHAGTEAQTVPEPKAAPPAPEPRASPRPPEPPLPPAEPTPSPPTIVQPQVPSSVKRYSLVDKPAPTPTVQVEPSSPDPTSANANPTSSPSNEPLPLPSSPAVANSLAALKKNDVLERRASKRFSMYNITKMTGASTSRAPSLRSHPHRRSLASNNVTPTPTELAVLTEEADEEEAEQLTASRVASPELKPESSKQSATRTLSPEVPSAAETSPPATREGRPGRITVFLQLGREVKKVSIEPPLSFASLRVLFVDKFSYNPGQDNFPAIYIRDPSSGVQYELEDVEEVKDKCLLSLNIEALDQIKQHIDSQISALSQDIKDLRSVVASSQKNNTSAFSPMVPDITLQPLAESTPARPTDRQFQSVARRLSRFVGKDPSTIAQLVTQQQNSPSPPGSHIMPQQTGQSFLTQQMTGASVMSEYSNRVVNDLKTQFDEVQNLRRDLATMRQIYTGFMKQTKETLGTLRTQTQSVKQLANTSVGGARAYIDSGKKKLDARSQDVLTEVEKLQDTVERVKDDVVKRNTTPKPQYFRQIKQEIEATAAELESLKEHIKTVKPMWKKTWEEELQNIVEEQQFLTHQEEFLNDLLEDHKAVREIYGHVEKIVNLKSPSNGALRGGKRTFRPPPPEEGHNGLSTVMLEIRGAQVDPQKRLKAIEESQKNRELEKSMRGDDMQLELQDFVGQKKLRMTGGAEEVERMRQKKDENNLKAMFSQPMPSLSSNGEESGNFDPPASPGSPF